MRGYKVFEPDWKCRGFQYAVGKTFEEDVIPLCCKRGFHFCTDLKDCFSYYPFDPDNKVAEVEALGDINTEITENKHCTNKIKIVRELSWEEVLKMVNTGKGNIGLSNSGNYNSGNYNTGDYNSNDDNSGNYNTGRGNSGNYNSGDWNTGVYNSGDDNSGNYNIGNWNVGTYNSGNFNSGDCNYGNWNSGNCNCGDYNSGDWNKSSFSSGCFNTKDSKIVMFNKPSDWTFEDWRNSEAAHLLNKAQYTIFKWICSDQMTDEEKESHPDYKTTGGYLKKFNRTKCMKIWWHGLSSYEQNVIISLPNFDAKIFKEITGINIKKEIAKW